MPEKAFKGIDLRKHLKIGDRIERTYRWYNEPTRIYSGKIVSFPDQDIHHGELAYVQWDKVMENGKEGTMRREGPSALWDFDFASKTNDNGWDAARKVGEPHLFDKYINQWHEDLKRMKEDRLLKEASRLAPPKKTEYSFEGTSKENPFGVRKGKGWHGESRRHSEVKR